MKRPNINRYKNQKDFEQSLCRERKCCRESDEKNDYGCSLSVNERESELKVRNEKLDLVVKCKNKRDA